MVIEEYDGRLERRILIGMILNDVVASRVASHWKPNSFSAKPTNVLAELVVGHARKYDGKAPKKAIQPLVEGWIEKHGRDRATAELLNEFLSGLSDEAERSADVNPDQLIDSANEQFNAVRLKRNAEDVLALVQARQIEKALVLREEFKRAEMGGTDMIDLLHDEVEMEDVFAEKGEAIVHYPGALGEFMQNFLERDAFVSFIAPNKSQKSMWLMDLAWRSTLQRRRTAVFVIGDLSKRQFKRRFYSRVAKMPFRSPTNEWPYRVKWPSKLEPPPKSGGKIVAEVDFKIKEFAAPLKLKNIKDSCHRAMNDLIKSKKSYLKLSCHPARSIDVRGIRSRLEHLEQSEGWVADVVVLDYADNLAPLDAKMDKRDQINESWLAMSALRQERHLCLVTATQADSDSFRKGLLDRNNFSDDRRKLDHVTAMIGINITDEERANGLSRLNLLPVRDGEWDPKRVVYVASCLPLGNPAVLSCW